MVLSFAAHPLFADQTKSKYPPRPLELGIFPHLSTHHLEKNFGVIAQRLKVALDRNVNFNAQLSFDFFKEDLSGAVYDIVFLQPFDYVVAEKKHGYRAIASQDQVLKAVLAVRPSSHVKTVDDIKGSTITLPPRHTAISYLIRDWLRAKGYTIGKDIFLEYESSHISCLQKALLGFADVCATAEPVLSLLRDKIGFDYNIIAETQAVPHTLFAVHPRLSETDIEKTLSVILHLHEGDSGEKLLKDARLKRFRPTKDSEYDIVRTIMKNDV